MEETLADVVALANESLHFDAFPSATRVRVQQHFVDQLHDRVTQFLLLPTALRILQETEQINSKNPETIED